MTAAMAFFSIALTLNLTGIKVTQLRAADFQPSRLRATLTRQYYSTNEQVTKYYENLRLVYEMESRVRELRRSTGGRTGSLAPGNAQAAGARWHWQPQLDRPRRAADPSTAPGKP